MSPDGKTLAADGGENVQLWDLASGRKIQQIASRVAEGGLRFSPDGQTLAVGEEDSVELWSVGGERKRAFPGETWVGFLSGGATLSNAFGVLRVRSASGHLERQIPIPDPLAPPPIDASARAVAIDRITSIPNALLSPDGHTLASRYDDGSIGVWDLKSGQLRRLLQGFQSPDSHRVLGGDISQIVFSPDGSQLAAGSRSVETAVWNLYSAGSKRGYSHTPLSF